MTNLTPAATFDDVQQLETTTVALGGPGAPMNVQAQALLNRTQYLYVQLSNLAAVASTGDYNSLINRPALGSAAYHPSSAFATAAQGAKADGAAQASALSAVAFSGSYGDLIGKPFSSDAPSDSNTYGRRNGSWVVVAGGAVLTNPMTTAGDLIIGGSAGAPIRLGAGATGYVLKSNGPGSAPSWQAESGGGSSLAWVNVTAPAYGAVGDGTTDDTAAFTAAVAAINASARGGVFYCPAGDYNTSGGFVFTKPVYFVGDGCSDSAGTNALTQIRNTSGSNYLFDFQADGWHMERVHLENTSATAPTAGAGVHATAGNGHRMRDVSAHGFWNNFWIENGAEWYWSECFSYGPVNFGALIRNTALPDGGDQSIVGCQFVSQTYNCAAAIRYESGGGLKITNTKINERGGAKASVGLDISIPATAVTGDLLLSNCSIENVSAQPIKMRNASGGTLINIIINGVQMARYGTTTSPIDIVATAGGVFDRLLISNCDFGQTSATTLPAISITNVDKVQIGPCVSSQHPVLVGLSGVTNYRNTNPRLGTGALTDAATIAIDLANWDNFTVTLGGNRVLANPTNPQSGQVVNIRVKQDGIGGRTLGFGTKYKFPGGTAPVISTGPNAVDLLSFQYDGNDDTYFLVANKAFS